MIEFNGNAVVEKRAEKAEGCAPVRKRTQTNPLCDVENRIFRASTGVMGWKGVGIFPKRTHYRVAQMNGETGSNPPSCMSVGLIRT